jgi:hypothetical protein
LKDASFPAAGASPVTIFHFGTGLFASILGALHHTRRIQSRRVLRQYRHLMFHGDQRTAFPQLLEDRENANQ